MTRSRRRTVRQRRPALTLRRGRHAGIFTTCGLSDVKRFRGQKKMKAGKRKDEDAVFPLLDKLLRSITPSPDATTGLGQGMAPYMDEMPVAAGSH